eukprot:scaffold1138_cov128-Cylindrotheca_fusiformis.AAC.34
MVKAYREKESSRINQRPITMSSVETLEMFRQGYRRPEEEDYETSSETSECSAILALHKKVEEIDALFEEHDEQISHVEVDEEAEFDQELSSLKHSLHLLQEELNAVDMLIPSLGSSTDESNSTEDRDMNDHEEENTVSPPLHEQGRKPRMPPPVADRNEILKPIDVIIPSLGSSTGESTSTDDIDTNDDEVEGEVSSPLHEQQDRTKPQQPPPNNCDLNNCSIEICNNASTTNISSSDMPYNSVISSSCGSLAFSPFSYDEKSVDDRLFFCAGSCTPHRFSTESYFWEDENDVTTHMSPLTNGSACSKDSLKHLSMSTELHIHEGSGYCQTPTSRKSSIIAPHTDSSTCAKSGDRPEKNILANWLQIASQMNQHKNDSTKRTARAFRSPIQRTPQKAIEMEMTAGQKMQIPKIQQTSLASIDILKSSTRMLCQSEIASKKASSSRRRLDSAARDTSLDLNRSLLSFDDSTSVYPSDADSSIAALPMSPRERKSMAYSLSSVFSDDSGTADLEHDPGGCSGERQSPTPPATSNGAMLTLPQRQLANCIPVKTTTGAEWTATKKCMDVKSPSVDSVSETHRTSRTGAKPEEHGQTALSKVRLNISVESPRSSTVLYSFESDKYSAIADTEPPLQHCPRDTQSLSPMEDRYEVHASPQSSLSSHQTLRFATVKSGSIPGGDKYKPIRALDHSTGYPRPQTRRRWSRLEQSKTRDAGDQSESHSSKIPVAADEQMATPCLLPLTSDKLHTSEKNVNVPKKAAVSRLRLTPLIQRNDHAKGMSPSRRDPLRRPMPDVQERPKDVEEFPAEYSNQSSQKNGQDELKINTDESNEGMQESRGLPNKKARGFTFDEVAPTIHSNDGNCSMERLENPHLEASDEKKQESVRTPSHSKINIPSHCREFFLSNESLPIMPYCPLQSPRSPSRGGIRERPMSGRLVDSKSPQDAPFDERKPEDEKPFTVMILEEVGNCIELVCGDVLTTALEQRGGFEQSALKTSDQTEIRVSSSNENTVAATNGAGEKADERKRGGVNRKAEITAEEEEIIKRNGLLLDAIVHRNRTAYRSLTEVSLVGIDLEGNVLNGNDLPQFDGESASMISPKVHWLSNDVAVVSYLRVNQEVREQLPFTIRARETRVWKKQNGSWINCHYHQTGVK